MPEIPPEPPQYAQYPRPPAPPAIDLWLPKNFKHLYTTQLAAQFGIGAVASILSATAFVGSILAAISWAASTDDNWLSIERLSVAVLPATWFTMSLFTYAVGSLTIINVCALRGQRITAWRALSYCGRCGNGIVLALVVGLLETIGYSTIVIPGLIVGALTMLAPPLMAFEGMSAGQATAASARALTPHFWTACLAYLLYSTYGCVGLLGCGVGIVATLPLASIPMATLYDRLFPMNEA